MLVPCIISTAYATDSGDCQSQPEVVFFDLGLISPTFSRILLALHQPAHAICHVRLTMYILAER